MPLEDEDRLVARAQDGDIRSFEALVGAHLTSIRRFARAFAASPADADDLAQEALVRVYRNLRSFRYQSAFSTWLYAIVRNVCLDAAKGRERTRRSVEEPLAAAHTHREGGETPHEALERAEERERVWSAIRSIPSEFRAALVLFDIEGRTYDEVAAIERVAVGTVKSRLHRARAHLARLLASPGDGAEVSGTSGDAIPSHIARKP